jgi:hypothetical protein
MLRARLDTLAALPLLVDGIRDEDCVGSMLDVGDTVMYLILDYCVGLAVATLVDSHVIPLFSCQSAPVSSSSAAAFEWCV